MTGIYFNNDSQTWNLFVDGVWICEGNYEYCEDMMHMEMEAE